IQRQLPGRISWEPLRGRPCGFRKSAAVLGTPKRPFMLSRAGSLHATSTELEPAFCHVSFSADLHPVRGAFLGGWAGLSGAGVLSSGILAIMTPFLWIALVPIPVFLGAGVGVLRQFGPVAERVQLGL